MFYSSIDGRTTFVLCTKKEEGIKEKEKNVFELWFRREIDFARPVYCFYCCYFKTSLILILHGNLYFIHFLKVILHIQVKEIRKRQRSSTTNITLISICKIFKCLQIYLRNLIGIINQGKISWLLILQPSKSLFVYLVWKMFILSMNF